MSENMCLVPEGTWKDRNRAINSLWLPITTFIFGVFLTLVLDFSHANEADPWRLYFFFAAVSFLIATVVSAIVLLVDMRIRGSAMHSFTTQELAGWQVVTTLLPPNTALSLTNVDASTQVAQPTAGTSTPPSGTKP
jgi:ABC-type Fe3+-siderophore transport system permease subunit